MRIIEEICADDRVVDVLREFIERVEPLIVFVGGDESLRMKALGGALLGAKKKQCVIFGTCKGNEPFFAEGSLTREAAFFRLIDPGAGLDQKALLKAFIRQDPDGIVVTDLEDDAIEVFASAMLTGHTVGTLIACSDASHEAWCDRIMKASSITPEIAHALFGQSIVVELTNQFPRHAIRSISRPKVGAEGVLQFEEFVRQRVPDFDLDRDEDRAYEFISNIYEFPSEAPKARSRASGLSAAQESEVDAAKPSAVTSSPIEAEALKAGLSPSELSYLRRTRRTALVPIIGEPVPGLLKMMEAASTSEYWPKFGGRPGLLALQLRTDELPDELSFLPAGRLLQLFFTPRVDQIQEWDNPFSPHFSARLIVPSVSGLPEEARISLMRECHPIERFDVAAFDYPSSAEGGPQIEPSIPHVRATKFAGWPTWAQGAERPLCPRCSNEMAFVFQFASQLLADTLVAPDFTDFLFVCREHMEEWAIVHQCS